jgi:hypothetical protein
VKNIHEFLIWKFTLLLKDQQIRCNNALNFDSFDNLIKIFPNNYKMDVH